ncbi:MAG: phospholipase D family protein [Vicinamibacterales bacterium]
MKLLVTGDGLRKEFARLIKSYRAIEWATAWAGVGSEPFEQLLVAKARLNRLVVGLHFYQTHPDFIDALMDHPAVRFIHQPDGTFHPKVYLFFDSPASWEMLVGSANFTSSAFSQNTEATVLLSSRDSGAAETLLKARQLIDQCWATAKPFSPAELAAYRTTWRHQQAKVKSLSGAYGGTGQLPAIPIFQVPIATTSWEQFVRDVRQDPDFDGRLEVLNTARRLFDTHDHFGDMHPDERKYIAGLPTPLDAGRADAGLFGSMMGNGIFRKHIGRNDPNISRALDQIPKSGQLTQAHFDGFVREFQKSFSENFISTATRLLAMKRPDMFVCFDQRNRRKMCKAFAVPSTGMTYERYWSHIVQRLADCEWWNNPKPRNETERRISEGRAAFLDVLFYEE